MSDQHHDLTSSVRWVSLCTLLSRVLGLIRDAAMAARFGNGLLLDAFTVAFRIPNLARALLGEGALATAFLPSYIGIRELEGIPAARRFAVSVILWLTFVVWLLVALGEAILLMLPFWLNLAPASELLRRLTMILIPYMGLICLAAQLGALLNAEDRFVIPALVPSVLNIFWLIGVASAFVLSSPEAQLFWMCGFIVLGGILQLAVPAVALTWLGVRYDSRWLHSTPAVLKMIRQLAPALAGLLVTQFHVLIDSLIAWGFSAPPQLGAASGYPLESGTASALYFGQRLYQFPLGVFGVALGTVLFPLMARHAQSRQYHLLRDDLTLGLRYVAAIGIPASCGLMMIAEPLASLCFEYGEFNAADSRMTAQMIAAYGSGVWAYCGLQIVHRGFYAIGDRLTPLKLSMAAVMLNLLLSLTTIWVLGGVALAWSTSLVSMFQCVAIAWLFRQKVGGWQGRAVGSAAAAACVASGIMVLLGMTCLTMLSDWSGFSGRLSRVVLPAGVAVVSYFGGCHVLHFADPWQLIFRRSPRGTKDGESLEAVLSPTRQDKSQGDKKSQR